MAEKRLALLIANAVYQHSELRKLNAPSHDVEALKKLLTRPEIGGYQAEVLVDGIKGAVEHAIDRTLTDANRDDTVLIFFAGHGLKYEDGTLYFAAADTEAKYLDSTAVSAGWLVRKMQKSRVRSQIVLLDCCFGGAFARGSVWYAGEDARVESGEALKIPDLESGRGQVVITSADAMQFAFEGGALKEGQPPASHFTRVLVEGLETGAADVDYDGKITVDELMRYLESGLQKAGSPQRPTKWIFGAVGGDLLFAYNPLAKALAESPSKSDKPIEPQQILYQAREILYKAREYEIVRELIPAGHQRTIRMEAVITKMRELALAGLPLLAELAKNSSSPGEWLAAVAILQKQPNLAYLDWLAARVAEDPGSFHGYHAAVALLGAARDFGASHREALKQAIETARTSAREEAKGADAFKVLGRAERELQENPQ